MKYLICQEWKNTKNNHTGMVHLCKLIRKKNPKDYQLIKVPDIIIYFSNKKLNSFQFKLQPYIYNIIYFFITINLLIKIRKGDTIFLFEYLLKERNQYFVARMLKFVFSEKICIYGLAHLTPTRLDLMYTNKELIKFTSVLDYNITLGSSLSEYLISKGIEKEKIITSFHYVDTNYYLQKNERFTINNLTVIIMGIQMRNFSIMSDIVRDNPSVQFIICQAFFKLDSFFKNCPNAILKGFMKEDELKKEMENADISMNFMIDTVGSNVITTSMAMGLALIVSDVGSIKDYCDLENTIFCKSEFEFTHAINLLQRNKQQLLSMQKSSVKKSDEFKFESFYIFLNSL